MCTENIDLRSDRSTVHGELRIDMGSARGSLKYGSDSVLKLLALTFTLLASSSCSKQAWLKSPEDLNSQLAFLVGEKSCKFDEAGESLVCADPEVIKLSEGMRIGVQGVSLSEKATNTVTPLITAWQWTIPPADSTLGMLTRDDLFILRYLAAGAVCTENCPKEKVKEWLLGQPFNRDTPVSQIFGNPRIEVHPRFEGWEAPNATSLCSSIRHYGGNAWPETKDLSDDESPASRETKALLFDRPSPSPAPYSLRAFHGSNWAFDGNLGKVDDSFQNGWLREDSVKRRVARQSLEAYLAVQHSDTWQIEYRAVCTTFADINREVEAGGFKFEGISRQCQHLNRPKWLMWLRKDMQTPLSPTEAADVLKATCPTDGTGRFVLKPTTKVEKARLRGNMLEIPNSTLDQLLIAPGDRIIATPRNK